MIKDDNTECVIFIVIVLIVLTTTLTIIAVFNVNNTNNNHSGIIITKCVITIITHRILVINFI